MPSLFPGMDPYIEGQKWPDFHHNFAVECERALMPGLRPRCVASVEERVYIEHTPETMQSYVVPDVHTVTARPAEGLGGRGGVAVLAAPVELPMPIPEEVREPYVEIRVRASGEVIAVIEILSPGNKRTG